MSTEEKELREERQARIAELEDRLARGRRVGVKAWVAALCIFGAGVLAWLDRDDFAYFFSSREPITLGTEGSYELSAIVPNRYVQLHGVPTLRAVYADEHGQDFVLVGLRDSPFIVKRRALPGEERAPGKVPPPPNQSPFGVRGRLMTRAQASRYEKAFEQLQGWGEVRASGGQLYLVAEGDKPGSDAGLAALMAVLGVFVALNAWFLVQDLRYRFTRQRAESTR